MNPSDLITAPPKNCSCGNPAILITIEVYKPGGRVQRGAFSEFGIVKGRTRKRTLRPKYRFKRWIAECLECIEHQEKQARMFG